MISLYIHIFLICSVIKLSCTDGIMNKSKMGFENKNVNHSHHMFDDNLILDEPDHVTNLSSEIIKKKLGIIVDKFDTNSDGVIAHDELKTWILNMSQQFFIQDTDHQWKHFNSDKDDKLAWAAFKSKNFPSQTALTENSFLERDEYRWKKADQDLDGLLSKKEFFAFLHPDQVDHMQDVVIKEILDQIDKNKDGYIDLDEYIKDMWIPTEHEKTEPVWLKKERDTFVKIRDKNNDHKMDRNEIKAWILPDDNNHIEYETRQLILQADSNHDGNLSKEEILRNYDLFIRSQATDFGKALNHDEL